MSDTPIFKKKLVTKTLSFDLFNNDSYGKGYVQEPDTVNSENGTTSINGGSNRRDAIIQFPFEFHLNKILSASITVTFTEPATGALEQVCGIDLFQNEVISKDSYVWNDSIHSFPLTVPAISESNAPSIGSVHTFDVTTLVQNYSRSNKKIAFIIKEKGSSFNRVRFSTDKSITGFDEPKLEVVYGN